MCARIRSRLKAESSLYVCLDSSGVMRLSLHFCHSNAAAGLHLRASHLVCMQLNACSGPSQATRPRTVNVIRAVVHEWQVDLHHKLMVGSSPKGKSLGHSIASVTLTPEAELVLGSADGTVQIMQTPASSGQTGAQLLPSSGGGHAPSTAQTRAVWAWAFACKHMSAQHQMQSIMLPICTVRPSMPALCASTML